MAGSKQKGPVQAAQPSSKSKQSGAAPVKVKSPLQQVTNAPSSSKPIAPAIEVKGKGKKKAPKAETSTPIVDRLKILEAKIEELNAVVRGNLPRTDQSKPDTKVRVLEKKIDRIETLLQNVVSSLAAFQQAQLIRQGIRPLSVGLFRRQLIWVNDCRAIPFFSYNT